MVIEGGAVEHLHQLAIDLLEAVAGVDEDERALQHYTAAQIVVH